MVITREEVVNNLREKKETSMREKIAKVIWGMSVFCMLLFVACATGNIEGKAATVGQKNTGYEQMQVIDLGETDDASLTRKRYCSYGDSEWDVYRAEYYYSVMGSNQQAFYDRLYQECLQILTGNETLDSQTYSSVGTIAMTDEVVYSGITTSQAKEVVWIFQMSNPQFYFVNDLMLTGYYGDTTYVRLGVYYDFCTGSVRTQATAKLKSVVDSWTTKIKAQSSVLKMQKKAHDLVISNTTYSSSADYNQSCYSVFANGSSVCAGYAEAYELLCNGVGIDTICVTSSDHEWNKSYVYGSWYVVDCTWDDTGTTVAYDYFNCSDENVQYGNTSHTAESFWDSYSVPECKSDAGTDGYLYDFSYVYDGTDYASVFDVDDYIGAYEDVRNAYGADIDSLLEHFCNYGMSEGRRGSSEFNVYAYANRYSDLQSAFGSDLKLYYLHYISNGKAEGRKATGTDTSLNFSTIDNVTVYEGVDYAGVYNASYYYKNNSDVAAAYGKDANLLLQHFVNYGMSEGRQGSSEFSVTSYRKQYADLRQAYRTDLKSYYIHYINYGKAEGRAGTGCTTLQNPITIYAGVDYSSVYDYNHYISLYSDIKNAFGDDDIAVLQHFAEYGAAEGRKGNASFGVYNYEAANEDVYNAYRTDYEQAVIHYIYYGRSEGRNVMPSIDIYNISTLRPDVYNAFGGNADSIIGWYITYGSKGM